jgi:thiamine-phosphate pyrophosphorylase
VSLPSVCLPAPPILLITDRKQARRPLERVIAGALRGGCRWISLREKDLPAKDQAALALRLFRLAAPFGARIMLHGDPRIAREAGLFGVHLPTRGDVRAARATLGPTAWVSASAHSCDELVAVAAAGADAVTLSPIFASASKPGYGPALGLEALAKSARRNLLPIIALGGITDGSKLRSCLEAGAAAVAVMGVIMRAADPAATMAKLTQAAGRGFVPPRPPAD